MSSDPPGSAGLPAPADDVLGVLAHRRRRTTLSILLEHDGPLTVADLARLVAMRERDADIEDVPGEVVDEIYLTLYHHHVPRLVEDGLADHEPDRNAVSLTEGAERLGPCLELGESGVACHE